MNKVYIFGAHSRAQTLAVYLQYLYPDLEIEAYLYNNEEPNPDKIGQIPVIRVNQKKGLHIDYPMYIGTRGIYHKQIVAQMEELGFKEIHPLTPELDSQLRNAYLKRYYVGVGKNFIKLDELKEKEDVPREKLQKAVYVVRSVFDQPLHEGYRLASYEREIQAGAALAEERLSIAALTDDKGKHISELNRQFCEMTAVYWIWKNATEDIVGIAHYRRHFILPEDWLEKMQANDIDVVLPVPLYVAPSLEENYRKRHTPEDWDYMMQCLREMDENGYREAERFFKGNLYSPCNMFIMKKGVLDEMCEWLFPLLFRIAEHGGEKPDCYQNRYPGFLSERLISFFFERNRSKYQIAYADKSFLR